MPNRKILLKISIALIAINLVLAGLVIFNNFSTSFKETAFSKSQENDSRQVKGATSVPVFQNSKIMSDEDFRSTRVFSSEKEVQDFLDSSNSPLKNFSDQGRRASNIIFAASRGQTSSKWGITPQINPGVILAYLEKEQSLISATNYNTATDPERKIASAMGYGCPDNSKCNPIYEGFYNQVNWAAYQLEYNIYIANGTLSDPYKVNSTITTLDNISVFLSNAATAAQYRYTPHVYWGNYNLWKIMVANGWGTSSARFSYSDIDRVNLSSNPTSSNPTNASRVTIAQVQQLLNTPPNIGRTGADIVLLQTFLRQEGYFTYPVITGYYGNVTQTALQNYIKDNGVPANQQTTCQSLYLQTWQIGQQGDNVRQLQECLKAQGLFAWPTVTGYFGNVTLQGLTTARSGVVNPKPVQTKVENSCSDLLNRTSWRIGLQSEEVRQLQACLRAEGTFSWPQNTGYFGNTTNKALIDYRAKTQPQQPASVDCKVLKLKAWRIGNESSEVKQLQGCLRAEGYFSWPQDTGYYGKVTNEALAKSLTDSKLIYSCEDLKKQPWIFGQTNERVRQLQICMRNSGNFNWPLGNTAYFGDTTKNALISYRGYFE
jgi:peptidoglycan hydrolase-like protein with peptidoglycan-binding domain